MNGKSCLIPLLQNAGVKVMTDATVYGDNRLSYPDCKFVLPSGGNRRLFAVNAAIQ